MGEEKQQRGILGKGSSCGKSQKAKITYHKNERKQKAANNFFAERENWDSALESTVVDLLLKWKHPG